MLMQTLYLTETVLLSLEKSYKIEIDPNLLIQVVYIVSEGPE